MLYVDHISPQLLSITVYDQQYELKLIECFKQKVDWYTRDPWKPIFRIALWDFGIFLRGSQEFGLYHLISCSPAVIQTIEKLNSHVGVRSSHCEFVRPPLGYQYESFAFGLNRRAVIFGHDRGVGKTLCGAGLAYNKMVYDQTDRAICLVPASVVKKWDREIKRFIPPAYASSTIVHGRTPEERKFLWESDTRFHITTLETLRNDWKWLKQSWPWGDKRLFMVIDELHRVKTAKRWSPVTHKQERVKRTNTAEELREKCVGACGLTGHDVFKLEQWYQMTKVIEPNLFRNFNQFCYRYLMFDSWGGVAGYVNESEFIAKMSGIMHTKTKEEVMSELPPKSYEVRLCRMSPDEKKWYSQLKKGKVVLNDMSRAQHLNTAISISRGLYLRRFLSSPTMISPEWAIESCKMRELKKLLEDGSHKEKIAIFTQWKDMVHILEEFIGKDQCETLTGDTRMSAQEKADQFILGDKKYIILDTAGGEAIDLHGAERFDGKWVKGIDTLIMYDEHDDPGVNGQVEDRIHRFIPDEKIIREWKVMIIQMRVEKSLEVNRAEILKENTEQAKRIRLGQYTDEDLRMVA